MKEIKWAVLGCGVIANEMAVALQKNGKNIYAVGNRTHEKAAAFAEKYGIGKVYDDFHEMLYAGNAALGTCDAVETSKTVAAQHASWLYERGDCQWKTHSR